MKIHREFGQRSLEWMQARAGKPTASEFDALLTPKFEVRKGQMPQTYLAKKVAEAWLGGPLAGFNTFDMDQGNILEEEALPWYELEFGAKVDRVGLCTTDDERVACSPDGLLGDSCGLEVKCPEVHTHVGYLLAGVLPPDYAAQVHGSMFVTGMSEWKFLSYCRRFPPLLLTVERDEAIQQSIADALGAFLERFDAAMKRLTEINGGPPVRKEFAHRPVAEPTFSEMPS